MRPIALVPVLVALATGAAQAQSIEVLTGEHGAFTRLALVLPPAADWSIEEDTGDHTLRIDRAGLVLDVSRAFTRIDRSRIAALESIGDGGALRIRLACDCPLAAYEDPPGILVIDVRDGPPRTVPPSEFAAPEPPVAPLRNPRRALMPLAPAPSARLVEPTLPRFTTGATQWMFGALDQALPAASATSAVPGSREPLPIGLSVQSQADEVPQGGTKARPTRSRRRRQMPLPWRSFRRPRRHCCVRWRVPPRKVWSTPVSRVATGPWKVRSRLEIRPYSMSRWRSTRRPALTANLG
jgi:hypothetical protein